MTGGVNAVKLASNLFRTRSTLFHGLTEVYMPSSNKIKEKFIGLIKDNAEIAKRSDIAKKLKIAKGYWTLEMAPPGANEMQKLQADLALVKEFLKTRCYKYLTVKQAWLLFLVGTEVTLWFYLGETIGKMHIVGYKV